MIQNMNVCSICGRVSLGLCIFHDRNIGKNTHTFDAALREQLKEGNYSFKDYYFPAEVKEFQGKQFERLANFDGAIFENFVDFGNCVFGKVRFNGTKFKGGVSFADASFNQMAGEDREITNTISFGGAVFIGTCLFERTVFDCDFVVFDGASFMGAQETHKGGVTFRSARFRCKTLTFNDTKFNCEVVTFQEANFDVSQRFTFYPSCQSTEFTTIAFDHAIIMTHEFIFSFIGLKSKVTIDDCTFKTDFFTIIKCNIEYLRIRHSSISGQVVFSEIIVSKRFSFARVHLGKDSTFIFEDITLRRAERHNPSYLFADIIFNSNLTFFQRVKIDYDPNLTLFGGSFEFSRCALNGVQFNDCTAGSLTYTNSEIAESRFADCKWIHAPYQRYGSSYLLRQDVECGERSRLKERRIHPGLVKAEDLYRQLYIAFDKIGDYQKAGQFYYNRWECRRHRASKGLGVIYWFYWRSCGYGERPLYATLLFVILNLIFWPMLGLFLMGLNIHGQFIKYSLIPSCQKTGEFAWNWIQATWISLKHTSPSTTLGMSQSELNFANVHLLHVLESVITILNILLLTFATMGIRRHFKRY
jgi:uncharacterized protein YjbI with pentapeptide repeats